jgi:hypothetical protein
MHTLLRKFDFLVFGKVVYLIYKRSVIMTHCIHKNDTNTIHARKIYKVFDLTKVPFLFVIKIAKMSLFMYCVK